MPQEKCKNLELCGTCHGRYDLGAIPDGDGKKYGPIKCMEMEQWMRRCLTDQNVYEVFGPGLCPVYANALDTMVLRFGGTN